MYFSVEISIEKHIYFFYGFKPEKISFPVPNRLYCVKKSLVTVLPKKKLYFFAASNQKNLVNGRFRKKFGFRISNIFR